MVDLLKKGAFFIAIAGIVGIFLFFTSDDSVEESETEFDVVTSSLDAAEEQENTGEQETITMVDVKGAITKPGVYEMERESRVNDVIQMAGGFTKDADQTQVNLAQKVQDEMIIIIPKEGEEAKDGGGNGNDHSDSEKIKMNHATQEEIENLNGIGASKAQAIIQYREEHGLFQTEEDLLEISGIGEKTLENFRNDIQIP
ncbi:helix-hairpin-helix domain-containing protein [Virgibacillus sp. NKC19-3]|uniref:helix-hairpin-helix domain-containing protein n=1 Tax=Virgibacillus saliphilus TaxID=2831674 RepID=UPI001C9B7C65|nr:helix-hairpin-helix domain-containing protein [Virgibacillus sp. NKC19-3]MBY7143325.1 helix-hairpin-helix domain-containing protein [Virgibacillus sp. NKC19-3]